MTPSKAQPKKRHTGLAWKTLGAHKTSSLERTPAVYPSSELSVTTVVTRSWRILGADSYLEGKPSVSCQVPAVAISLGTRLSQMRRKDVRKPPICFCLGKGLSIWLL